MVGLKSLLVPRVASAPCNPLDMRLREYGDRLVERPLGQRGGHGGVHPAPELLEEPPTTEAARPLAQDYGHRRASLERPSGGVGEGDREGDRPLRLHPQRKEWEVKETVAAKETDFSLRVARKRTGEGDAQTGGNESHSDRRFHLTRQTAPGGAVATARAVRTPHASRRPVSAALPREETGAGTGRAPQDFANHPIRRRARAQVACGGVEMRTIRGVRLMHHLRQGEHPI